MRCQMRCESSPECCSRTLNIHPFPRIFEAYGLCETSEHRRIIPALKSGGQWLALLQEAKNMCREVMRAIRQLREKRDMSINEIKLTLAIEDPTAREKRDYLGIEVRSCPNCANDLFLLMCMAKKAAILSVPTGHQANDKIRLVTIMRVYSKAQSGKKRRH